MKINEKGICDLCGKHTVLVLRQFTTEYIRTVTYNKPYSHKTEKIELVKEYCRECKDKGV